MRTLALRGDERVAVVAAEWRDAFGVVTSGRVQLELRDGSAGPELGLDAGFWLRGTGVRALHNPGRSTATVLIVTPRPHAQQRQLPFNTSVLNDPMKENAMNSMQNTAAATGQTSSQTSTAHPFRKLVGTGLVATVGAMAANYAVSALAQAAGAEFQVPDGGETIPLSGIAFVTGVFSIIGVVIAAALLRWSARPAQ